MAVHDVLGAGSADPAGSVAPRCRSRHPERCAARRRLREGSQRRAGGGDRSAGDASTSAGGKLPACSMQTLPPLPRRRRTGMFRGSLLPNLGPRVSDPRDQLQADLAERYVLERELGRGGMATVYLAHDIRHKRSVALKVLHPELANTLGPERFRREIETVARLQHPHILTVHDSGESAGHLWFTMPYVEGESLRDRVRRERQLPIGDALQITREVADALGYAHRQYVIHRDIKPENILLSQSHALVADFGIARAVQTSGGEHLTETGSSVGTPAYMSPEQSMGDSALDGRSDLYSLGCVLYEMLTGEAPYSGASAHAIIAKRLLEPVPVASRLRVTIPPEVDQALQRVLAKAPADRFASAAEFTQALAPPLSSAAPVSTPTLPAALGRTRALRVLAAAALVVLLAGTAWFLKTGGGTPTASPEIGPRSIAVLPFTNLRGDSSDLYLSDGISQEILAALGQVPGLAVAGRSSSFRFRGPNVNAQQAGRELQVASLLSGTIQRTGGAVRVTAELVDVRTGYQLWSNRYDRSFANLFALEDEIAGAILQALSPKLAAGAPGRLVRQETSSAEAHDLALRARALYQQADEPSLQRAVALYQQALKLDSTYAGAWAGLSNAYGQLADQYRAPREMVPLARAAALRAVALDDNLAEGHQALAVVYNAWDWDFAAAAREFRRALALDPGASETHLWYGIHLSMVAMDSAGGAREMKRAAELDPLNPMVPYYWGAAASRAGDYRVALAQAGRLAQLTGTRVYYGTNMTATVYAAMGRWQDCVSASTPDSLAPSAAMDSTILAICLAHLGQRGQALRSVQGLEDAAQRRYVDGVGIADLYFALGDLDRAFAWLQRACDDRSANMTGLRVDFDIPDAARRDPRYAALLARMGLPRTGSPYAMSSD